MATGTTIGALSKNPRLASDVSSTVRSFRSASACVAASTGIVVRSVAWNVNWVALLD